MWGVALFASILVGCGSITYYLYANRDVPGRHQIVRFDQ
jgi:hypothetical protein